MKLLVVGHILLHFLRNTDACTEIRIIAEDEDSTVIIGRSMEYGIDLVSTVIRETAGTVRFANPSPKCKLAGIPPMNWTNINNLLFVDAFQSDQVIDGLNAAGLSVGSLMFPGYATYDDCPLDKCGSAVSHMELPTWILGNFETVQQVREAIDGDSWPVVTKWFPLLDLHYSVTDKTGDGIIIEYTDQGVQVYNNTLGVLTNAPKYDWHMLNFHNYVQMSNYNRDPLVLGEDEFDEFGQGSGLLGMPGDFTPPSRLVRAAILKNFAAAVNTSDEAINLVVHIMNNVDIPIGVLGEKGSSSTDYTQWIVIKDLQNNVLYFRGYEDVTLYQVNLDDDFSDSDTQPIPIDRTWGGAVDITSEFESDVGHTELR